ncbi:MAG TPA: O-antigen ligase family protein [Pseudolabrys sp.]|nr:O-antigen ligase family protein [Pseudolabrys sp.]
MNKSKALSRFNAFRTSRVWFLGADILAVLLAAALPWSTSVFSILMVPLLAIICGSVDVKLFVRSVSRPPSVASIAFFTLAAAGVLWSEAGFSTGVHALGPLVKFLVLPFLLYYFEASERGAWVIAAFLFSCVVLLINSWVIIFEPTLAFKTGRCCGEDYGVPVRNYIDQSQEFSICLVVLFSAALFCLQRKMWKQSILLSITSLGFAANLIFVVVSRTALVSIPVMFLVVAWRHGRMRSILAIMGVGGGVLAGAWFASPHLRTRVMSAYSQFQEYRDADVPSSVGKRLEFWQKSVGFFRDAPLIGHGTGTVLQLFQQAAIGRTAVAAEVIANPHNQTFSVAIQWGIVGLTALYALWLVHLRMFLKQGFVAELGLIVIVQNVIGSLFNSHLFDFTEGWLYVLGVGIAGGIIAKRAAADESNKVAATVPTID